MSKLRKLATSLKAGISYFLRNVHRVVLICCIVSLLAACAKDKPPDLGSFAKISDLSISPDGNQILFNGCGHKDYQQCTIYRFDRSNAKLYRYLPPNESELIWGGRYASASSRFVSLIIPLDPHKKQQLNAIEVALVNQDGSGLQRITQTKGATILPMLSYDEKTLVFFKGQLRTEGKTAAAKYDLYKIDLQTGKETRVTRLSFYGVSEPHFTPDGKNVIFGGETPMQVGQPGDAASYREYYKRRYKSNIILQYPLDGSSIDRLPVPLFIFRESDPLPPNALRNLLNGSKDPKVTKDGSIWFEGQWGPDGFRGYYRRLPDGNFIEIPYVQVGISKIRTIYQQAISWDGQWMVTLNVDRNSDQRSIGILDIAKGERYEVTVPAEAENIFIR